MAKTKKKESVPSAKMLVRDLRNLLNKRGEKAIKGDFETARLLYLLNQNKRYRDAGYNRFDDLFEGKGKAKDDKFRLPFSSATGFRLLSTYRHFAVDGNLKEEQWNEVGPSKLYNAILSNPRSKPDALAKRASKQTVRQMKGSQPLQITAAPTSRKNELELCFTLKSTGGGRRSFSTKAVELRVNAKLQEGANLSVEGLETPRGKAAVTKKLQRVLAEEGVDGMKRELGELLEKLS